MHPNLRLGLLLVVAVFMATIVAIRDRQELRGQHPDVSLSERPFDVQPVPRLYWLDVTLAPELQQCDYFGFHLWPEGHQWETAAVGKTSSPLEDGFALLSDKAPEAGSYSIALECNNQGLVWDVELMSGQRASVYLSFTGSGDNPQPPVARYALTVPQPDLSGSTPTPIISS